MRILYCLTLMFLLGSSYVAAHHHMKRAPGPDPNSNNLATSMSGMLNVIVGVPVIGPMVTDLLKGIANFINDLEVITNGALGRVLGGAVPCTVSLSDGLVCTGVDAENGGVGKFIMEIVNSIPNLLLPSFFKKLIGLFINAVVDPTFDVTFGGITVP